MIGVAGVLSALFVNDVVCLVLAPLVIELTRQLELPPVPYLIALATASNVGSVATLTGNPQNMLVGSFSGIGYRSFLWRQGPVAVVGLLLVLLVVWLVYRRQLPRTRGDAVLAERFPVHYPLMVKTGIVVLVMLVAFLAGVPIALVAISGAAYTLLTRRVKPEKVYRETNWQLLVPAVLLLKSLVPSFAEPGRAWLVVAMASTFAGNLTLVGSVANLIVVEAARGARIDVGFGEYCRVGVPLTLLTLLLGWFLLGLMPAP